MGSPGLLHHSLSCGSWRVAHCSGKNSTLLFTKATRASFGVCGAVSTTGRQSGLEGEALRLFPPCKLGLATSQDSGAGRSSSACEDSHTTPLWGKRRLGQPVATDTPQAWRTSGFLRLRWAGGHLRRCPRGRVGGGAGCCWAACLPAPMGNRERTSLTT